MLFSSPIFLFLYLPVILLGYWLVGNKLRNLFLLVASFLFYAWGEGQYVLLLLFSIIVNYLFGLLVARYRGASQGKLVIWLALVVNLGALAWYKYAVFIAFNINFVTSSIGVKPLQIPTHHFPLGISFFTFQAIAYLLDVYREETTPQKNVMRFALFMALFPKLVAGPIIRYGEVAEDLADRKIVLADFAGGVRRFVIGLGKKVLIADTIAITTNQIFAVPQQDLTTGVAWLGICCYTLQLYFDFSGYTDMALGLGRMFGFKIQENFNYPYIARSLTDFWRRWHISLSTWLRDYLYIPLSYALMTQSVRNKIAQGRYKINYRALGSIVTVFTLCGLWHGAGYNYILWGMVHGFILALESLWLGKVLKQIWRPFQHAYLVLVVTLTWVLFRSVDVQSSIAYYKSLLGLTNAQGLKYHLALFLNNELILAILIGIAAATPIAQAWVNFIQDRSLYKFATVMEVAILLLIIVASFASMASSTFSPFIYQQF